MNVQLTGVSWTGDQFTGSATVDGVTGSVRRAC